MTAFLVCIVSHAGIRVVYSALARTRLDAQFDALDKLTEPPRYCCAHAIGNAS